jgi:hypothetical protein
MTRLSLEFCHIQWDLFGKIASDSMITLVEDFCLSENEVTPLPLLPNFFVYNHILEVRISSNRTRRNIIVYEVRQSKMKSVDELCLSINDHIFAHKITDLYDHITGRYETPYFSNYECVCLTWVNIDNGLMKLGRNRIWWNATETNRGTRQPKSKRSYNLLNTSKSFYTQPKKIIICHCEKLSVFDSTRSNDSHKPAVWTQLQPMY